jgi:hypothetical protein
MGVEFVVCNLRTEQSPTGIILNYAQRTNQSPYPLLGITRLTDSGVSNKVQVPYKESGGAYKTVWVPMGQQGWTVDIQCSLMLTDDSMGASGDSNPIYSWLMVDSGMLLEVKSNQFTRGNNGQMGHLPTHPAISKLPPNSYWYVDKILINSREGYMNVADMQLTLVRFWG